MAANRGEIAIRIFRAATELDIKTVSIYSKEDFNSAHRYKADESFLVGEGKSPIAAYLAAEEIVEIAKEHNVDAIHPGYGFLSENAKFVELCEQAGIAFIGPPSKVIKRFGDKTEAQMIADLRRGIRQLAKRQRTWFRGLERRGIQARWIGARDRDALLNHPWAAGRA